MHNAPNYPHLEYNADRQRRRIWPYALAVLIGIAALLCAPLFVSCAGAPHSAQQLEQMDEAEYHAWLDRVAAWSTAAGATVALNAPGDAANVDAFAAAIVAAAGGPLDPHVLVTASHAVPWASPLIAPLILEGQALLDARGGLPGGERGAEVLRTIATALRTGLAAAMPANS